MSFQPCTYIMTNRWHGVLYVGVTSDLEKRVYQHCEGVFKGFTSRYRLHRLVLFEQFGTMELAIAHEKRLKNWHRDWKINHIEASNTEWRDLAVDFGIPPLL